MLQLPKSTEVNKPLPKKAIYAKFQMNTAEKEKIDKDISRITIVNEISSSRINISEGVNIKTFFVVLVALKQKQFSERTIITISKLIPQNMVMILQFEDEAKLVVYRNSLLQSDWKNIDDIKIELSGLNMDKVWENVIVQIGDLQISEGNSLDEQIVVEEKKKKLIKDIEKMEKQARSEKQPKKKFELVSKIRKLKIEMEKL